MADVGISAITEAELRYGVARKTGSNRLELAVQEFLIRVEILPWDSPAARHHTILRSALEDSGTPMGNLEMMIAAHALAADAILVTHNRVFHRVRHLKVEDWTKAG